MCALLDRSCTTLQAISMHNNIKHLLRPCDRFADLSLKHLVFEFLFFWKVNSTILLEADYMFNISIYPFSSF